MVQVQQNRASYVDVTVEGITVTIPRDDTAAMEHILHAGAAQHPLQCGLTEPNVRDGCTSGAIVVDDLPEETVREMARDVEDAVLENGFAVAS